MRISLPRIQKGTKGFKKYLIFIYLGVSFLFLILSTRSFFLNFSEAGVSIFSGLRGGISTIGSFFGRTVLSIRELSTLRSEYSELLNRLEKYETLERDVAEVRKENTRLKEQLGFSEQITFRHIPSRIIGKDPDNLFQTFILDKGTKDGIKRNMPVIAYQNGTQGLVGKIIQVSRNESFVMPIYDNNSYIASRLTESRFEGICAGQGSQDLPIIMSYIKKRAKDEIRFGDIIISSGIGGIYPQDIVVGRVSKIILQDYDTSLSLELEPIIDFSRLEYVFILESNSEVENE